MKKVILFTIVLLSSFVAFANDIDYFNKLSISETEPSEKISFSLFTFSTTRTFYDKSFVLRKGAKVISQKELLILTNNKQYIVKNKIQKNSAIGFGITSLAALAILVADSRGSWNDNFLIYSSLSTASISALSFGLYLFTDQTNLSFEHASLLVDEYNMKDKASR